jgi:aryl-alcohol dehydrogenase-like predicted oxidoreductase
MKTRTLPGTDLELSVVGFGAWAIGGEYWGPDVDDARSIAAVRRAVEGGINWFDTAPLYGHGRSEELLVEALGPHIERVTIATKVGVWTEGEHAQSKLTPEHLRADLEATLKRLGTESIDLLQVHWPCEFGTPLEESFRALDDLRHEGKFRYLGVCNYDAEALRKIAAITPIVSLQTPYSLLRREFEGELRTAVDELELGVIAYEPLCRGLLTGKFRTPPRFPEGDLRRHDPRFSGASFTYASRVVAELVRIGQKVRAPTAAVALGWAAAQPSVTAVAAGAKTPEQVEQNAIAGRMVDEAKLWAVVNRCVSRVGAPPRPAR